MISFLLLLSCAVETEVTSSQVDGGNKAIVRDCSGQFSYVPKQPGLKPYRPPPPPPPPEPGWAEKAGKAWDDWWKEPPPQAAEAPPVGGGRKDSNPPAPQRRQEALMKKPATGGPDRPPVRSYERKSSAGDAARTPSPAPAPMAAPMDGLIGQQLGSGGLGTSGSGLAGGGGGLGGLGTKGLGSGSSGYGSGAGNFGASGPRSEAGGEIVQEAKPVAAAPASEGWGDEIHLSNDDSMSLASAQRLLWAAEKGSIIQTNEVRPHELLNYFHFDTQAPTEGQLFGVKGSAVADEKGKITLAFAVAGAVPARRPLDLTLVLDRSGSMSDEGRMDYLKRGLLKMQEQLVEGDRVDMVVFDTEVCTPLENYVVGRDDAALLTKAIDALVPRSGTNVDIGLKEGYAIAGAIPPSDRNRRMLLITDALLNTGD
ncbi:MAG TPA: VWA domain-containing protein, partial [Myxococcota bacterium]|nr:VWA domain-containing protein [Myxococcota bacterium]